MSEMLLGMILLVEVYRTFVKGSRWERQLISQVDAWERRRAARKRGEHA